MVFDYGENVGSYFLNLHQKPDTLANLTNRLHSHNNRPSIWPYHSVNPTAIILTNKIGVPVIKTNI